MKLYDALILGKNCGLETVNEAITNVEMHGISLFSYVNINMEFHELYDELEYYIAIGGSLKDNISEALKKLEEEEE